MTKEKLHIIRKILSRTSWLAIGIGTIVLLCAAMNKKSLMLCKKVEITISGAHNNIFIDEKDVEKILHQISDDEMVGKPLNSFDLSTMKSTLEANDWIKKAVLYFDNNEIFYINILEREPIARIISKTGNSFYIDTSSLKIPLSEKFSARLPVFTGFNDSAATKADTLLLTDIKNISQYINKDPFWMAQIDQIDISPERTFTIVPKIGNQVIYFGNAEHYEEKFRHLYLFYKNVLSKVGWNKYSLISLEYKDQIISVKRGSADVKMDSLKTDEIMKGILLRAQMQLQDSTGIQLSQKDELVQQVIPLENPDLPDENLSLINPPKLNLVGNIKAPIKKDSIVKVPVRDSIKSVRIIPAKVGVVKPNSAVIKPPVVIKKDVKKDPKKASLPKKDLIVKQKKTNNDY